MATDQQFPKWTAYSDKDLSRGRDFLGIQNVGNQMMNALLPGLTGATRHVRYYNFICWALWKCQDWGKVNTIKGMQDFLYKLENLFLYAVLLHEEHEFKVIGVVGERAAKGQIDSGRERLPLEKPGIKRRPTGFDVVNYRPSMTELGLVVLKDRETGVVVPSANRGMLLAEAYEKSIKQILDPLKAAALRGYCSRKELARFSEYMCLCRISHFPEEQAVFKKLLLGEMAPVMSSDQQRKKSLLFLLDALRSRHPGEDYPKYYLPLTAHDLRGNTKKYIPPPELTDTALGWAIFQHRANLQYAITGLWAAFLIQLEQGGKTEQEIENVVTEWCRDGENSKVFSKEWSELEKVSIKKATMSELAYAIGFPKDIFCQSFTHSSMIELNAWANDCGVGAISAFSEDALWDKIKSESDKKRPYALALYSLMLLLISLGKWGYAEFPGSEYNEFLDEGGTKRLSCRKLRDDLALRLQLPIPEFLLFCLRKYVVDQHYIFAAEKMLVARDTFHFYQGEDGLQIADPNIGQWGSASYIDASLRLLHGLGMVSINRVNDAYSTSIKGETYLKSNKSI